MPRCNAVQHNFVTNSKIFIKCHPFVKIGVIIRKSAICIFRPFHHRWIMNCVFTVSLAIPCLFDNRCSNCMTADLFVLFHDRLQDFQMLFRKRCHSIVFCTGIRVLPQFNIKCILEFICIRQNCILYFYGIMKYQRRFDSVCCCCHCPCISSCFRIFWDIECHPYRL